MKNESNLKTNEAGVSLVETYQKILDEYIIIDQNDKPYLGQNGIAFILADHEQRILNSQWVRVSDRLPETGRCFVLTIKAGYMPFVASYNNFEFRDFENEFIYPTHWMLLPNPPTK